MKKIMFLAVILSALVAVTSCSGSKNNTSVSPTPTATPAPTVSASPTQDTSSQSSEADLKTMSVTYTGRIDTNFIEVLLSDGSYSSLRLSADLAKNFDSLGISEGSKVEIKYTETDSGKTVTEFIK